MPRQNQILQVFVASPSDVSAERATLETVIAELNHTWSRSLGVTFELLKWETNVRPSFSTDAQASINEQIGQDYDVFIGVFWSRLGTATPRAGSGSVEEFEQALHRFTSDGQWPEIMLYFKQAPMSPSDIVPAQLQALHDFKKSLSGRGGLYSEFDDIAGFEASLRSHLAAIADKATLIL